jgi:hypothetical protein
MAIVMTRTISHAIANVAQSRGTERTMTGVRRGDDGSVFLQYSETRQQPG